MALYREVENIYTEYSFIISPLTTVLVQNHSDRPLI